MQQKKIGIITFYHLDNYGSLLQAYALSSFFNEQGFVSELISFDEPNYLIKKTANKKILRILNNLPYLLNIRRKKVANAAIFANRSPFSSFRDERLKFSKPYRPGTLNTISDYSAIILGSDQVLNPYCLNDAFALNFTCECPFFVYSASVGINEVDKAHYGYYQHLAKAERISCREESNSRFLDEIINKKVDITLDPVLLYDRAFFDALIKAEKKQDLKGYALYFLLGNRLENVKLAHYISKRNQYKNVVTYPMCGDLYFFDRHSVIETDGSFSRLLLNIKNANLVITDSYHIMLMAIIYQRDFVFIPKHNDNSPSGENVRITDFLRLVGLENRFVQRRKDYRSLQPIDYSAVFKRLKIRKQASLDYLNSIISRLNSK